MNTFVTKTVFGAVFAFFLGATAGFGQTTHSGSWTKKSNSISGTWSISEQDGKKVLSLKGFKTSSAPDLKIFLTPKTSSQLNNKNATSGAVKIAKLKKTKGDQSYVLPSNIDLSQYKSVIVHCERFSKLWGVGTL